MHAYSRKNVFGGRKEFIRHVSKIHAMDIKLQVNDVDAMKILFVAKGIALFLFP